MRLATKLHRSAFGSVAAAALAIGIAATPAPLAAQSVGMQRASGELALSQGRGQLITLPAPMNDIFMSNDAVADVQVRSPTQLYIFGKSTGETTLFVTSKSGKILYSANVRVGQNLTSIDQMLRLAMPEAEIQSTTMNGLVLLTGTVRAPEDAAEVERLVTAFVGEGTQVIARLRTATPLQVNLRVKIAEVNRNVVKQFGFNLFTSDPTSGFGFAIGQGRAPANGRFATIGSGTTFGFFGNLLGLDISSALDLAETDGLSTTLAEPNLTALSGETASFLAGGEFPIPISSGLGDVSVEFKQFGVSLAFTPFVLADGRISMRVRPEVSQLSAGSGITLGGVSIPGTTTRRAETTVELGSGESFMIAGLLQNTQNNAIDKAPGLGDIPILGALFRSNSYRRSETELVIVVTPVLVKPVSANQIALPTDGYRAPDDSERMFLGQHESRISGAPRPKPRMDAPVVAPAPSVGAATSAPQVQADASVTSPSKSGKAASAAAPGFTLK